MHCSRSLVPGILMSDIPPIAFTMEYFVQITVECFHFSTSCWFRQPVTKLLSFWKEHWNPYRNTYWACLCTGVHSEASCLKKGWQQMWFLSIRNSLPSHWCQTSNLTGKRPLLSTQGCTKGTDPLLFRVEMAALEPFAKRCSVGDKQTG